MIRLINQYKSNLYPFLAVSDQALQSLVNLLSNVVLIRYATKAEYGVYGVGFASILLIQGLAHALFSLQMTVIAPNKSEKDRLVYFGSVFVSMIAITAILVLFAILGATAAKGLIPETYRILIIIIALSTPGVLIMQFLRQCFFFFRLAHWALILDVVFFLVYFGSLSIMVYLGAENLHYWALLINGGVMLAVGLVVLLKNTNVSARESVALAKESLLEAWGNGSWAMLGSLLTILQTQGYVYLLAIFRGPTAVAEMNAARLFLSPLLVMNTGFSKVMIPKMALLKSEGKVNYAVKLAIKVMFALIVVLIFYMSALMLGWDWIENSMADRGYNNLWVLFLLWGLYFFINTIGKTPAELLQVFQKFRLLTLSGAVTAVLVLSLSVPAIIYYGTTGAMVALILGEIFLAVLLWNRFQIVRKTEH